MLVSVHSQITYPSYVRRRYVVTLTDLHGREHVDVVGMYNHQPDNTGEQVEADLLASKTQAEIESYKSVIREGNNPFLNDSLWNSRAVLLKAILDDALSLPATDSLVYNGLQYLELASDEELMAIYSKDIAWVDNIRAQAIALLASKDGFDNYQPVGVS